MENCRIAGPIFIVLGLIFVTVGRTKYYSERANAPQPPATVMMSTPATATVGYQTNPAPIHYQPQVGGYPPQKGAYPPQAHGYPVQAQVYPQHAVGYHPQAYGYQQAGYVHQAGGYPPQAHGYQQGGYVHQPAGGYIPAQNYPPQGTAEGQPNAPPAYDDGTSAPPPEY